MLLTSSADATDVFPLHHHKTIPQVNGISRRKFLSAGAFCFLIFLIARTHPSIRWATMNNFLMKVWYFLLRYFHFLWQGSKKSSLDGNHLYNYNDECSLHVGIMKADADNVAARLLTLPPLELSTYGILQYMYIQSNNVYEHKMSLYCWE